MLGYITEKEALKMGFTHHGKCFGIPIWITDEEAPMVATKFVPFEFLLTVVQMIERRKSHAVGNTGITENDEH